MYTQIHYSISNTVAEYVKTSFTMLENKEKSAYRYRVPVLLCCGSETCWLGCSRISLQGPCFPLLRIRDMLGGM